MTIARWSGCVVAIMLGWSAPAASSCVDEVGAARAEAYLRHCLAITPAALQPCRLEQSCATLGAHIQTSCAKSLAAPDWCRAYKATSMPNPPPTMPAPRTGFDCAKATTPVDIEICQGGHDQLAEADRRMANLHARLVAHAGERAAELRAAQQEFLQERQRCADPERGVTPVGLALVPCIDGLTRRRAEELITLYEPGRAGPVWTAYALATLCTTALTTGGRGGDQIELDLTAGALVYSEVPRRFASLSATDSGSFDVDGVPYAGHVVMPDGNGHLPSIASRDPSLVDALRSGRVLRVRRNGKVVMRALLTGFVAAHDEAKRACGKTR